MNLGPVALATATMQGALEYTDTLIQRKGHRYFCFCEASLLSNLIRDRELALTLKTADAVFPDGVALVALARLRGHPQVKRVPGPSFLLAAAQYGVSRGWRHFFFGGGPGVANKLAKRLELDYPGILIAGTYTPPFRPLTDAEDLQIRSLIESVRSDLLWVCLGSPKQERWCAQHLGRINVPLMLAVGAAFDFHAGSQPWAPAWVRGMGMEWAFRTVTGGKRILLRNVLCVSRVGVYMMKVALTRLLWGKYQPDS